MKKVLVICLLGFTLATFAGPPPHHGGHRPAPPPARYQHGYYRDYCHYRNNGIGLAESIVSLVGAGVNILRPVVYTVIEPPQGCSVIQQPQPVTVPVVQPVYTAPVAPAIYPVAPPHRFYW